ncbi:MAG: AI-2E family transporter [Glycocaulis sp.]|mgnify:CR=1 FL=1
MSPPVRAALLIAGLVTAGLLVWQLSGVLLLVFASVLLAIILRSFAGLFERFTPLRAPWTLAVAGVLILAGAGTFLTVLGTQIYAQLADLVANLPETLDDLGARVGIDDLRDRVTEQIEAIDTNGLAGSLAGYTFGAFDMATTLLVVVVSGVYLAMSPSTYIKGAVQLFPSIARERVERAINVSGGALKRWLLGQLISMTFVGVVTTLGLYLIGMPSALALGLLAGLAEFVPLVGPIAASVPAILLALAQGGNTVVWVILLFLGVQQIDGNIVVPLVQKRAVKLPPALMLFSILSAGALFGIPGVILAVPMAVLVYVLVKQLYIRDTLREDTPIPGQEGKQDA